MNGLILGVTRLLLVFRNPSLITIFASGGSGAVGGLVASVMGRVEDHINAINFFGTPYSLGFVGDLLIGFAAGVAILLVTLNSHSSDAGPAPSLLRIAPMGLLAGIAGAKLLVGMSDSTFQSVLSKQGKDLQELSKRMEVSEKAGVLMSEAEAIFHSADEGSVRNPTTATKWTALAKAEVLFKECIALDATSEVPHMYLSKIARRRADLDPTRRPVFLAMAVENAQRATEVNPQSDRSFYNLAAYRALRGEDPTKVLDALRQAIHIAPGNKTFAATDSDFITVTNLAAWKRLVNN